MGLWGQIESKLDFIGLSSIQAKQAKVALRTLSTILGPDFSPDIEAELAEVVTVPSDSEPWIVFGSWADGSLDIIRQSGTFKTDVMIGWIRGQSRSEYNKSLLEEESSDGEGNSSPDSGGERVENGTGGASAILPGSGVRGNKRGSKRKREGDNNSGQSANGVSKGFTAGVLGRSYQEAAESLIQHRTDQRPDEIEDD